MHPALAFRDHAAIVGGEHWTVVWGERALLEGVLTHDGGLSGGSSMGVVVGFSEFEGKRAISKVVCAPVGASGSAS